MALTIIDDLEVGRVLSRADAEALMEELLCGRVATVEIVRLLTAMNLRAPQVAELAGFATAMRRHAAKPFVEGEAIPERMVDTCGTGGKTTGTFNISTTAALVASAAGARVAKHGNRGMSSRSGSADVLEALGVRVDIPMARHGQAIREIGIGFLFAQMAHASMQHAVEARKKIGVRTVFNLLGPLTNPAGARFQVVGVPSSELVDLMAATLAELGTEHAFVVHGAGGLDEISLAGETVVAEVEDGAVTRFTVTPEDFGVARSPLVAVAGGTPQENAGAIRRVLDGEAGPRRDIVMINAAAALVATGIARDFRAGAELAAEALLSGAANKKLATLVAHTQQE
jgi:anthranilate phosphoribosyltransferase